MLKRKLFAVALPIIAGATIVGSGFAAWVFSQEETTTKGLGVSITEKLDIDGVSLKFSYTKADDVAGTSKIDLTSTDKLTLVLDQGKGDGNEQGIYFAVTDGNTKNDTLGKLFIDVVDTNGKIAELDKAGYEVKFGATAKFNSALFDYLTVKTGTSWSNLGFGDPTEGAGTKDYKSTDKLVNPDDLKIENDAWLDFTSTKEDATKGTYYKDNKMFSYNTWTGDDTTGKGKPTNKDQYNTMLNYFKTKGFVDEKGVTTSTAAITLDFTLNISEAL